jgi:Predicted transcriptional regulators
MSKEYKLSEVASKIGVHRDTILYWEQNNMIPLPRRNINNNYRTYNADEIQRIIEIRGVKSK